MGLNVWLLPLMLWGAIGQTEVATTEQAPYPAQVLSISSAGVELEVGGKLASVSLEKLRRLSFTKSPAGESVSNLAQGVTLRDGSTFRYQSFNLVDGKAQFELEQQVGLALPAASVQHVQFQPLGPQQWTQWRAIVQSRSAADMLVLIRSAEGLEKLEGIISKVTPEQVTFDFGGQSIDAPLAKLAGLCFFAPVAGAKDASGDGKSKLVAIVRDRQGNRWMAAAITLQRSNEQVELTLQCGSSLLLPLQQLAEIDFSFGSMRFLVDLEPLRRETEGSDASDQLPLGLTVAGADGLFGAHRRDLQQPGLVSLGPSIEFLGSSSISYRVPVDFSRLRGEVELRPTGNRFTPCQARVLLENKVVWEERLSQTGRRFPIDIEVNADARLRIEVVSLGGTAVGDVVLWHDLRLVK